MTLSQEFPCHIKLLSPLSFLFVCLFFVCFSVAVLLFLCCFVAFWLQVHNEKMVLPQMNRFSYGKKFIQNQFCKRGHKYVACNSFCKYLAKQPYAKFVQFWPNYQILRGFGIGKLIKILKFTTCENYFNRSKILRSPLK